MKKTAIRFFARFFSLALFLVAFLLFEAALLGNLPILGAICLIPAPALAACKLLYVSTLAPQRHSTHSAPVPPSKHPIPNPPLAGSIPLVSTAGEECLTSRRHAA